NWVSKVSTSVRDRNYKLPDFNNKFPPKHDPWLDRLADMNEGPPTGGALRATVRVN
ncbi:hypothetical protein A2U01_0014022, partial [Trifolium medium]|nr:hypothetical protein [Trifolium medium]